MKYRITWVFRVFLRCIWIGIYPPQSDYALIRVLHRTSNISFKTDEKLLLSKCKLIELHFGVKLVA